jgi:hypothetical protein
MGHVAQNTDGETLGSCDGFHGALQTACAVPHQDQAGNVRPLTIRVSDETSAFTRPPGPGAEVESNLTYLLIEYSRSQRVPEYSSLRLCQMGSESYRRCAGTQPRFLYATKESVTHRHRAASRTRTVNAARARG